jgi:hypothetical protein
LTVILLSSAQQNASRGKRREQRTHVGSRGDLLGTAAVGSTAKDRSRQRREAERELAAIERKINTVMIMAENSGDPKELVPRLNALVSEREALRLRCPPSEMTAAITLHPNAAERYRQKVATVHEALRTGDAASREAVSLVRELIESISVTPTDPGEPTKLELSGNLAALLGEPSANTSLVPVVAGARKLHKLLFSAVGMLPQNSAASSIA